MSNTSQIHRVDAEEILFDEWNNGLVLFENQTDMAKKLASKLQDREPPISFISLKAVISGTLKAKRPFPDYLREAIFELITEVLAKQEKEDLVHEYHEHLRIAIDDLEHRYYQTRKEKKSKSLVIGAGYGIQSAPIMVMMERDPELRVFLGGTKENGKLVPFQGVPVEENIPFGGDAVPFNANDLLQLLLDEKIDLACMAAEVLEQWKAEKKADNLISAFTIIDSSFSGVQLHFSTRNDKVIQYLEDRQNNPEVGTELRSDDDLIQLVGEIRSIHPEIMDQQRNAKRIPFLVIKKTVSESEARRFIIENKEMHGWFSTIDKATVERWRSLFELTQGVVKLAPDRLVGDTFFFAGWEPHLSWLRRPDEEGYKGYTFNFIYVQSPYRPQYFNFVGVVRRSDLKKASFRKKLEDFVVKLKDTLPDLQKPDFLERYVDSVPLLRKMGIQENDAESFFDSLLRIRFDVKFLPEYVLG